MKTQIKKTAVLGLVALMTSLGMSAQQGHRKGPRQERAQQKEALTPAQQAALQTKKMTLALDLNSKQQKAVESLFMAQANERETMRSDRDNKKEVTNNKRPSKEERYERSMALLDKRIAHKTAMKDILTEDQFKKWEKEMNSRNKVRNQKREQKRGGPNRKKGPRIEPRPIQ